MALDNLDDDTLICILGFLPVPSILNLRQTCRRLCAISKLRFIWQSACINQVLSEGFPFPIRTLATADSADLETAVLRAIRLGKLWLDSSSPPPSHHVDFQATTGTGISHVHFLAGHGARYLITVYKGIWSMITCWDIGLNKARKIADWCPKNTIFSGFVTNRDPDSEASLAVSVQHGGGTRSIELLSILHQDSIGGSSFRSVCNIATTYRPVALHGDLIAFSDDGSETVVMNWRKNTFALLKGSQRPVDERFQYNRCLEVIFAYKSVLVVRARTVELFPEPVLIPAEGQYATYQPVGFHTFGWIDGVSVNTQSAPLPDLNGVKRPLGHQPLSILLRAESDDPWASDIHKLEQFVLHPNPAFEPSASSLPLDSVTDTQAHKISPYIFPPVHAEHTSPTVRGILRCRDIILGPCGTALWIQPRAARIAHLTGYDVHSSAAQVADAFNPDFLPVAPVATHTAESGDTGSLAARTGERLCAAVFAGPLQRRHLGLQPMAPTLWVQTKESCNWTAFDYDEETGRVAMGLSDGSVTVLDLV